MTLHFSFEKHLYVLR